MIAECPDCGFKIEVDEKTYAPHTKLQYGCPNCGRHFEVIIPERTEPNIREEQSPSTNSRQSQTSQTTLPNQATQNSACNSANNEVAYTSQVSVQNTESHYQPEEENDHHKASWKLPVLLISLAVIIATVFAVFVFLLPYLKDKNAPRMYTIANRTNMRSSKDAGGDYNKVNTLPFGSELITYEKDAEWTKVKDSDGHEGYIATSYLADKADFLLLNSIFGDAESRENVATVKCRKAVLNYFKENHLFGKTSPENLQIISPGASLNSENQWQIFSRAKGLKPNSVYFGRITNPNSKYTDFAVIIKNISTNARRILLFSFEDNETPHLYGQQDAPAEGYITSMENFGTSINISYSN